MGESSTLPPTFGEKAVGLAFNPGGDPIVNDIKRLFADTIDVINDLRTKELTLDNNPGGRERIRMYSVSLTELQTAQMWAVKAVTWKE